MTTATNVPRGELLLTPADLLIGAAIFVVLAALAVWWAQTLYRRDQERQRRQTELEGAD